MKNKKLVSFALAAAMVTTVGLAAGCNPDDGDKPEKLAAPVVSISGNVISWNAVENAEAYDVYEGTEVVSEALTACSYTIAQPNPGTYEYTVVATATDENYSDSDKSNVVQYTVPAGDTSTKLTGKIYLVGDSTVCSFADKYYMPRYGYGTQLYNYINCDASQIVNLAVSGKSSWSLTLESQYNTLTSSISAGDYLIIGFGHNDEKTEDARYANPNLPYTDTTTLAGRPVSFANILYNKYIKVAQDAGATPILCTPIVRLNKDNNYSGTSGHITSTSGSYAGGDYAQAIRDLGAAVNVDVIDLTELTKADYTALGYDEAANYHAYPNAKWTDDSKTEMVRTSPDTTHTNLFGAKMNAYYIASSLLNTTNSLAAHIRTNLVKPTYEEDYAKGIYTSYVPSEYEPFNPDTSPKSVTNKNITAEGWYSTAFGYLGGDSKVSTFTVNQVSETSFTVGNSANNGKIKDTDGDGFAAVFRQLSVLSNFKITATVTLDTYAAVSQSGFGIMLRDDIYIDKSDSGLGFGNYVAAGCYLSGTSVKVNYTRTGGSDEPALTSTGTATLAQGENHTLSIEKVANGITITFDNQTAHYDDFELSEIDSDYMYLCLFATRGTIVTFSDVNYIFNGLTEA